MKNTMTTSRAYCHCFDLGEGTVNLIPNCFCTIIANANTAKKTNNISMSVRNSFDLADQRKGL